jgi:hypothetical protein
MVFMTKKEITRKFKYYEIKIEKLWAKKQRVEALVYMSLLVEFFVREAIIQFEKIVEGAAFQYHVGFNPRNLYSKSDIDSKPLGDLVRILDTYTKDKVLIEKLKKFSKIRNKCIHKLLDHEAKEVYKELKDFNKFYYELMISLFRLNLNQLELVEKHFAHMCDDCFKEALPEQVKL